MTRYKTLPIDDVLIDLERALTDHPRVILQAPPGAGKTTRVPLALLDAAFLKGQSVLMLEPRRLAASSAARFMASCLDEEVGLSVGYTIRYDRKVSSRTRIEVVTEGVLARRLQTDPELTGIGLIIFDEFHERNLYSDLALALCLDAQQGLREDLKILIMSATLDGEPLARLLGDAPLITSAGRSYPVEINYLDKDPAGPLWNWTASGVERALKETEGDVLVFLPGVREILRCRDLLEARVSGVDILPLYGALSFDLQEQAIVPGPRRKVVLATNVAETSLTIEGVRSVVDSGFARQPRFDAAFGLTRLETVRISAASATQRAGRSGRLGPGVCYRLWSEGLQGSLLPFSPPEIRTADLAPLALELARWGVADPADLIWLDPPPPGALARGRGLLQSLGAFDDKGRLTPTGEQMAALPAHPRLARLLVQAQRAGCLRLGCDLVALLSERDIQNRGGGGHRHSYSDVLDRLELLWAERRGTGHRSPGVARAVRYWRQLFRLSSDGENPEVDPSLLGVLLAAAYPDRIGQQRLAGERRYLLSSGQGGVLSSRSALNEAPFLVAVDMEGGEKAEGAIHIASALSLDDIRTHMPDRISSRRRVVWDAGAGRIVSRQEETLGAIVLSYRQVAPTDPERIAALLEGLRRAGAQALTWSRTAREYVDRINFMRRTFVDGGWPDLSIPHLLETVEVWLAPFLGTQRTLADLARVDLLPPLQALLDWEKAKALDRLAPTHVTVPSGTRVRIDYSGDGPPVLAVKLQELFGLAETPAVAAGRVPLLLHLLSPARRPLQVTADLRSFWNEVYPEVKKEYRGRYPRHPWPDDPWQAEPTRHVKKRR